MAEPVDWNLAVATGARLAPTGPETSEVEAAEAVSQLRSLAIEARGPVQYATGLSAPEDLAVAVVDRPEWIRSNVAAMRTLTPAMAARITEGPVHAVGSRLNALQLGAALAWLSGRVLGQFEALPPDGQPSRLLLVAPNIVTAERELDADPRDFRMWVCLHEETHRVQFGASSWLSEHFSTTVAGLVADLDAPPGELVRRLTSRTTREEGLPRLAALQSAEQRTRMSGLLGLMSLLEGHADWVMDNAAPEVVPSALELRQSFEERRRGNGPIDLVVRKLLGMDAKLAQYREGARFVRIVVEHVGLGGFNRVWESPETLPTLAEIKNPASWLGRLHPDAV